MAAGAVPPQPPEGGAHSYSLRGGMSSMMGSLQCDLNLKSKQCCNVTYPYLNRGSAVWVPHAEYSSNDVHSRKQSCYTHNNLSLQSVLKELTSTAPLTFLRNECVCMYLQSVLKELTLQLLRFSPNKCVACDIPAQKLRKNKLLPGEFA